jgi:hypothetical protein
MNSCDDQLHRSGRQLPLFKQNVYKTDEENIIQAVELKKENKLESFERWECSHDRKGSFVASKLQITSRSLGFTFLQLYFHYY